jgi:hypothetical protein
MDITGLGIKWLQPLEYRFSNGISVINTAWLDCFIINEIVLMTVLLVKRYRLVKPFENWTGFIYISGFQMVWWPFIFLLFKIWTGYKFH